MVEAPRNVGPRGVGLDDNDGILSMPTVVSKWVRLWGRRGTGRGLHDDEGRVGSAGGAPCQDFARARAHTHAGTHAHTYTHARTLLCTWLSTDGGMTWKDVAVGTYIYEYADFGGLLIMAKHPGASDTPTGVSIYGVEGVEDLEDLGDVGG
eukprot:1157652-Pelagomonas_calceolata.AAC.16